MQNSMQKIMGLICFLSKKDFSILLLKFIQVKLHTKNKMLVMHK